MPPKNHPNWGPYSPSVHRLKNLPAGDMLRASGDRPGGRAVTRERLNLGLAVALAAAVWVCAARPAAAAAADRRQRYQKAIEEGKRLLAEARWDEALSAYGPWGDRMRAELQRQMAAARGRDPEKLLRLHEAYFRYYPFGYADWHGQGREWGQTACEYAASLRDAAKAEGDETVAQTVGALETYRKLMAAHEGYKEAEVVPLVDEIVAKHPKSLFAPGAVLSLAHIKAQNQGGDQAAPICEKYLPLLQKGGAGERSQIMVLFVLGEAATGYRREPSLLRKGMAAYLEMARRTDIGYEKRVGLLKAAQAALGIGEGEALAESRKLFRKFLAKYPEVPEADEARHGLVQTHLAERQIEEALQVLRELEKQSPEGSDLSPPLFDISRAHFAEKSFDKALAILQEIVQRYPGGGTASMAWLGMGEVYEKLGQEAQMVEAYKNAAAAPSAETQTNIMDASDTRNRAHQWLGTYYMMKKQDWPEALKWWGTWEPRSWCGTCAASMNSRKAHSIAVCLVKMGKADEALKTLEPMVFEDKFFCGADIAILLVDLYRDRGKLGEVEARLQKARECFGAKLASEYVALIRMAEKGDAEGLWKHLQGSPSQKDPPSWQPGVAARLLVSIPEKAKPFALKQMDAGERNPLWASAILARMKAPETLALVRAKVQGEENSWQLQEYLYALALLGTEEAYAQLRDYAARGEGNRQITAKQMLERYPNPGDAARDWPW